MHASTGIHLEGVTMSTRPLTAIAILLLAAGCSAAGAADAAPAPTPTPWQQVGWGGGAFYYGVAWHPTDGNCLYLSGDCAGVYRSEDKGRTWRLANAGMCDYAVLALATGPAAPDQVYALTASGLCKSTDRAKTWRLLPATAPEQLNIACAKMDMVRPVAIDPRNAEVVYAGSLTGKLYKSVDGGEAWQELPYRESLPKPTTPPGFLGAGALSLAYGADHGGMDTMGRASRLFGQGDQAKNWSAYKKLSLRFRLPEGAPALQAALAVQTGASWAWQQGGWTDGKAAAWIEASLDLSTITGADKVDMLHIILRSPQAAWQGEVLVDALALHTTASGTVNLGQQPDGTSTVLVADWEKPGDAEGWRANTEFADSLHITAARQSQGLQSGGMRPDNMLCSVAIAAGDPNLIFAANNKLGLFRSDDAGATWTALDAPRRALGVTCSALDANEVWAACGEDGIRHSTDRGRTWSAVGFDPARKPVMREIVLPRTRPGLVYAIGSVDWGGHFYRSEDGGKSWVENAAVHPGLPGDPTLPQEGDPQSLSYPINIAVNPQNPDELFIAGNWRDVFSADGGRTLQERSSGADNSCVTDIQFLGAKTYVTAMDEGLLVSDNGGGEWRQLLPLKWNKEISGHFWRVRVATVGDAVRIVTTSSPWDPARNRIFRSIDDGRTFAVSTVGLPDYLPTVNTMWGRSHPRALAADPSNPDILYLGMDGDAEAGQGKPGGGVFRSADAGKTWQRCASQPGSVRMYYGLVVDPSDTKRLYWGACGKDGGIWRSEDSGTTWEHVFQGESWSFNVEVTPSGTVLACGTNLHRSTDHGKTWTRITAFSDDPTIVGVAVDPSDERRLWISRTTWDSRDRGGILATRDGGASWLEITGDIPFRKPQILRYNPATHELWAGGVGLFKTRQ
jgi:photosystem II stability/assembly factor-like uncharacterized protein